MTPTRGAPLALACLALTFAGCEPPPPPPPPPPAAEAADPAAPPPAPAQGAARRVALFVPHEDLFWADFKAFMEAATTQLDLELRYYVADNSRERMKEQLREATTGEDRVDAVVFQSFKRNGQDLLRIAEAAGVAAFMVNALVEPGECGKPREQYRRWIGSMVSDSVQAGRDLAELLFAQARALGLAGDDGKLHAIAIGGIVSDQGSRERLQGLEHVVAASDDVLLHQVVPTDWSREDGRLKADALLRRFPEATVVWAASDPLALAAIDALQAAGRRPGGDAVVGGFDWTAEALEAVRAGTLHATLGGEFMAGGWVAVLLHDYLRGRDFGEGQVEFQTSMRPITRANVERFFPAISRAEWTRVDFRGLTGPGEAGYAFDAVETLKRLAAQ